MFSMICLPVKTREGLSFGGINGVNRVAFRDPGDPILLKKPRSGTWIAWKLNECCK
jgi:hypothetical protein